MINNNSDLIKNSKSKSSITPNHNNSTNDKSNNKNIDLISKDKLSNFISGNQIQIQVPKTEINIKSQNKKIGNKDLNEVNSSGNNTKENFNVKKQVNQIYNKFKGKDVEEIRSSNKLSSLMSPPSKVVSNINNNNLINNNNSDLISISNNNIKNNSNSNINSNNNQNKQIVSNNKNINNKLNSNSNNISDNNKNFVNKFIQGNQELQRMKLNAEIESAQKNKSRIHPKNNFINNDSKSKVTLSIFNSNENVNRIFDSKLSCGQKSKKTIENSNVSNVVTNIKRNINNCSPSIMSNKLIINNNKNENELKIINGISKPTSRPVSNNTNQLNKKIYSNIGSNKGQEKINYSSYSDLNQYKNQSNLNKNNVKIQNVFSPLSNNSKSNVSESFLNNEKNHSKLIETPDKDIFSSLVVSVQDHSKKVTDAKIYLDTKEKKFIKNDSQLSSDNKKETIDVSKNLRDNLQKLKSTNKVNLDSNISRFINSSSNYKTNIVSENIIKTNTNEISSGNSGKLKINADKNKNEEYPLNQRVNSVENFKLVNYKMPESKIDLRQLTDNEKLHSKPKENNEMIRAKSNLVISKIVPNVNMIKLVTNYKAHQRNHEKNHSNNNFNENKTVEVEKNNFSDYIIKDSSNDIKFIDEDYDFNNEKLNSNSNLNSKYFITNEKKCKVESKNIKHAYINSYTERNKILNEINDEEKEIVLVKKIDNKENYNNHSNFDSKTNSHNINDQSNNKIVSNTNSNSNKHTNISTTSNNTNSKVNGNSSSNNIIINNNNQNSQEKILQKLEMHKIELINILGKTDAINLIDEQINTSNSKNISWEDHYNNIKSYVSEKYPNCYSKVRSFNKFRF